MDKIGQRRERIKIYKRTPIEDSGDAGETLVQIATVWAARNDMSQRAFAGAGASNYEQTVVFMMRTLSSHILEPGITVETADGTRYKAVQVIRDRPLRGQTELRVINRGLEGTGLED